MSKTQYPKLCNAANSSGSISCLHTEHTHYYNIQYLLYISWQMTHDTHCSPTHITQRFKGALLLETVIDSVSLSVLDVHISAQGFNMRSHALSLNMQACLISLISQ